MSESRPVDDPHKPRITVYTAPMDSGRYMTGREHRQSRARLFEHLKTVFPELRDDREPLGIAKLPTVDIDVFDRSPETPADVAVIMLPHDNNDDDIRTLFARRILSLFVRPLGNFTPWRDVTVEDLQMLHFELKVSGTLCRDQAAERLKLLGPFLYATWQLHQQITGLQERALRRRTLYKLPAEDPVLLEVEISRHALIFIYDSKWSTASHVDRTQTAA